MDPFSNLGVAGAIIQLTDFGTRFGRNMINMYKPDAELQGDMYFKRTAQELQQVANLLGNKVEKVAKEDHSTFDPNQKVMIP